MQYGRIGNLVIAAHGSVYLYLPLRSICMYMYVHYVELVRFVSLHYAKVQKDDNDESLKRQSLKCHK